MSQYFFFFLKRPPLVLIHDLIALSRHESMCRCQSGYTGGLRVMYWRNMFQVKKKFPTKKREQFWIVLIERLSCAGMHSGADSSLNANID